MEEKLVTVAVFRVPYEAGMAKGKLEAYDIPAFVADEFTIGANPFYSNALGGIKLQVPASYAEEAHQILSEELSAIEGQNNDHRTVAKSFVWLYLLMSAAAGTAFVVYFFMKL